MHMEMQVEHDLPAGRLVELLQRDAAGAESLHGCGCHLLHRLHAGRELGGAGVEHVARGRLGDHQHVPVAARHDVHEGQRVGVLVHFLRRQLAAQDLRKDVVVVVGHRRLPSRMPPLGVNWPVTSSSSRSQR